MSDQETLHFKLGLKSTSKHKQPLIKILVSGTEFYSDYLDSLNGELKYIEFDADILEGQNTLQIILLNKESIDTVLDENGKIVEDMILSIDSIEIDDIDLGTLKWTLSKYFPIYPEEYLNETQKSLSELTNFVDLGWNGTWELEFQSPFYIWLLENL